MGRLESLESRWKRFRCLAISKRFDPMSRSERDSQPACEQKREDYIMGCRGSKAPSNRMWVLLSLLAATNLLAGCATAPVIVSKSDVARISEVSKVVLLPLVDCRDVQSDNPCSLDQGLNESLQASLLTELRKDLTGKHIEVSDLSEYPTLAHKREHDAKELFRITKLDSSQMSGIDQERLSNIAMLSAASHILSVRCRLYVGPGGSWDPNSGAITSSSSRMVLEASMFSVRERKGVWTRMSQARVPPKGSADAIASLVAALLSTIVMN